MIIEKYSARMVKSPTFFREMVEVGKLKFQGIEGSELRKILIDDNILKITPPRRNKEITSAVLVRVNALTNSELSLLVNGSLSDKKQIVMISIMKTERIIREFINEVYVDKLLFGHAELEDVDFNTFFRLKAEEQEAVAKWKDVTVKKLKQVFKKILKELELISVEDKKMRVLAPMPTRELLEVIEGEEQSIRKVFEKGR
ncbi:MAG: hypothetical protein COA82_04050 [Alkaliphilus sp.]|nr:MAG: hypothetical protein COA82_04050 [Alkaliphilus sp.]